MEIQIIEEKDNPLLKRKEVRFKIIHEKGPTPKREEVLNKLSSLIRADKELLIIDSLNTQFGKPVTEGYAKVYNSVERMKFVEPKHKIRKNTMEKEEREE
ncbi:MAG: 30S ribosomal protein S24e [Candidatus Hydrothermarchaeota archaeon]